MSATFRSASNSTTSGAGPLTIDKPAGAVEGDRLYAFVTERDSSAPTAPSDWSLVDSQTRLTGAGATESVVRIYEKEAGGSEPSSYTWTVSAISAGVIVALIDAGDIADFDMATSGTTAVLSLAAPSVDAAADGSMLLVGGATGRGSTYSYPGGVTLAAGANTAAPADHDSLGVGYDPVDTGATGTRTVTYNNSQGHGTDQMVAFAIVVNPASTPDPVEGEMEAASETDSAGDLVPEPGAVDVVLEGASETDTAGEMVGEVETAGGTLEAAGETDTAGDMVPEPGPVDVGLEGAGETDEAGDLTPDPGAVDVGLEGAGETDSAGEFTGGAPAPPTPGPAPVAAPPSGWSFVLLTDLSGEPIGEIPNAYDRKISYRVNRAATASFRTRLDDPLADQLLEGKMLVKLYEDDELRLVADIVGSTEKGEDQDQRIDVAVGDPAALRFAKRLVGKSTAGMRYTSATDRGQMVKDGLDTINAERDTGVRVGTITPSASNTGGPWFYKPLADLIAELSAPLDGFDWQLNPVEPEIDNLYPGAVPVIATLDISPSLGIDRPEAIFEYGYGCHNVKSYERTVSKQGVATAGYSLPPGTADTIVGAVQSWSDAAAIAEWGLYEAVIPTGDLGVDELRLKLVQEHIRVRGRPQQLIKFTPVREDTDGPSVPKFRVDYDLGDRVPFRAVVNGKPRINVVARVYGVDIELDNEGAETVTPILVQED